MLCGTLKSFDIAINTTQALKQPKYFTLEVSVT